VITLGLYSGLGLHQQQLRSMLEDVMEHLPSSFTYLFRNITASLVIALQCPCPSSYSPLCSGSSLIKV
jgi:hypothetical protein